MMLNSQPVIGESRLLGGREAACPNGATVNSQRREPAQALLADSLVGLVLRGAPLVAHILRPRSVPKVAAPVIPDVAVDVIDDEPVPLGKDLVIQIDLLAAD